jgi:quinol monooxygenase YgiN
MLAVMRYRVDHADAAGFRSHLTAALDVLRAQRGFVRGHIGRAADDPKLWILATEWQGAGSYRRALSSYDVKVNAVATLSRAIDEPGAFEVLETRDG